MTQDDTIRVTLRMPAELHLEVSDSASVCGQSLNSQLNRLIEIGLREDVMSYLMGVPHELWVQEYEKWREASEERQDGLWEDIKRIWAMRVSRGTRTKRHAA